MQELESRLYSKSTQTIAIWGAILYFTISAVYLWISTFLASNFADSLSSFRSTELIKGTLFMIINACIFGLIFWIIVERLRKRRLRIAELEDQIVLLDRRALMGTFIGALAHDMNNMLCGIVGWMGILKANVAPNPNSSNAMSMLETSIEGLNKITERLTNAGQHDASKRLEKIDPLFAIDRTLDLISQHERLSNIKFERFLTGSSEKLLIDLGLFQQMLINLVLNAADASGKNGVIRIVANSDEKKLTLEVHDNGPGISTEDCKNIFNAYNSSKVKGGGLGLLSVKACAEMHDGEVEITNSPLGGAQIKVSILSRS
jgi:two-component system sensor histidine kinase HydH